MKLRNFVIAIVAAIAGVMLSGCFGEGIAGGSGGGGGNGATLKDSNGNPLGAGSKIAASRAVSAGFSGLPAYSQVLIMVNGPMGVQVRPKEGSPCSFCAKLSADSHGNVPDTVFSPRLPVGSYTGTVLQLPGKTPAGTFSFQVVAPSDTVASVDTKALVGANFVSQYNFHQADDVYVSATGLAKNKAVDVYVTAHVTGRAPQSTLVDLSDYVDNQGITFGGGSRGRQVVHSRALSGTAETVTTDAKGGFAPLKVWSNINAIAAGMTFDVVVDVNQNGKFDPGIDVAMDPALGSFGVTTAALNHIDTVRNLSFDSRLVASDRFEQTEKVVTTFSAAGIPPADAHNITLAEVYVVAHQNTWKSGDTLKDISGPNATDETESFVLVNGVPVVPTLNIYWPDLLKGSYDIVLDVNDDGKYTPGVDILDGGGTQAGFTVNGPAAKKKWTVMVYLNGDNNLEGAAIKDFNEMEKVVYRNPQTGQTDVNVVVQFDRIPGFDSSNGDWTDTRRFIVAHDNDFSTISTNPTEIVGEKDMGDPATLAQFISWAERVSPADHYALVVWDHGAGFRSNVMHARTSVLPRNASWDDTSGHSSLTVPQIHDVLQNAGGVDLLNFDCCLMGMTEIAYEMRDVCKAFVGSEDLEPGDGSDYTGTLTPLVANPNMSPVDFAKSFVSAYRAFYQGQSNVTNACQDESLMGAVATKIDAVATELINDPDGSGPEEAVIDQTGVRKKIQDLLPSVQTFAPGSSPRFDDYGDAIDFFTQLKALSLKASVDTACTAAINAIKAATKDEFHDGSYPDAHGLTLWLPDRAKLNNYNREYADTAFARDTQWDEFLAKLWGVSFRIQLTWGADPRDLDSHLINPKGEHCFYANKVISDASLDLDDTTSFGPENIVIDNLSGPGFYQYGVHYFAGDPSSEPATVRVFKGSNPVPVKTYTFSGWTGEGVFWNVFKINGDTGEITDVNASVRDANLGNLPAKHPG